ncbi:TetR/AcrR family transcriptional regulator [Ancylobacter sp. A5.8]|uniref:TetR/AcrR family transcriptional regulator n=1 Tax=Ancylobacter gelatini TaxID=2919920 RepID=UPI001F4ED80F|nr:TetR/AcrR family transcriptional regulator [Ancylobacter gelatini]MCJ8144754.1 TetR/AcrR family transcriptional regulator [Ancylobacter gelatini]
MSWSRNGESRGYHHGNLREALMQAALDLIAEKGMAGATFAEAARRAGVSPAAPYRHFRDRDELIAAVAAASFDRFARALQEGWADGKPNVAEAFERMGRAYLDFARTHPADYIAMFESGIATETHGELQLAGQRAFAVLRDAAEALVAAMPASSRPPALMVALHIWSLSHGVASLFGRADGARRKLPMTPEELLEAGFLVYLRGLNAPAA